MAVCQIGLEIVRNMISVPFRILRFLVRCYDMGVIRMKFSSLGIDSEAVCPVVSVDRIQLPVRAVLFIGAVGLTRRSDVVDSIWHPLLW